MSSTNSASNLALRTIKFCSLLFFVVVHVGCDKQDHWCVAFCAINCTVHCCSRCLHCSSCQSDSQIFVKNHDYWLPHLHSMSPLGSPCQNIAMTFGMEKQEWCGYLMVKIFWRYVYSLRQNPRIWQTDGQTPHDSIGCTGIAWCGGNVV